jgi:hypothetical protein
VRDGGAVGRDGCAGGRIAIRAVQLSLVVEPFTERRAAGSWLALFFIEGGPEVQLPPAFAVGRQCATSHLTTAATQPDLVSSSLTHLKIAILPKHFTIPFWRRATKRSTTGRVSSREVGLTVAFLTKLRARIFLFS